ncbi:hypothetical protein AAFF_G00171070 [Aldrovandia affinis]|uniref:Uncharacterized protein n=1 Tax=Aldrovandia affinis TaxID=143900 RepID=A0AAD7RLL5_9TELE|nr:hypothetical protein AAFF_G00171070 [Aldrovandia affinis]
MTWTIGHFTAQSVLPPDRSRGFLFQRQKSIDGLPRTKAGKCEPLTRVSQVTDTQGLRRDKELPLSPSRDYQNPLFTVLSRTRKTNSPEHCCRASMLHGLPRSFVSRVAKAFSSPTSMLQRGCGGNGNCLCVGVKAANSVDPEGPCGAECLQQKARLLCSQGPELEWISPRSPAHRSRGGSDTRNLEAINFVISGSVRIQFEKSSDNRAENVKVGVSPPQ